MTSVVDEYSVRPARPDDYEPIVAVVDEWWGRPMIRDLSRLFLDHFHTTSLVAATDELPLAGFLIGFPSPSDPETAYIHFVGVHPGMRRAGLARDLYERFFTTARFTGRTGVKAITSPDDTGSIAFHDALGFTVGDTVADYDGQGLDRVVLRRAL
ncbi:GNAT family N-acetyltransferase [Tsukamurella sp. 8F]|uniref:GNAT family N-acetyltransferase n=1 Tax=unclassified Tsukamurella TaxID=2633480 RepID=UPI0023B88EBC|nr:MULTISPECIES: GNAT family N-acetyltransferase [unclassified Tsukamurella]MDF0529617.1 GNAT family N-acetyltransferase [Tsukamurella sp. 8J]MDF0589278.1 GNAT family N-acetyltransferase [Tsukamurella sp. 8F]